MPLKGSVIKCYNITINNTDSSKGILRGPTHYFYDEDESRTITLVPEIRDGSIALIKIIMSGGNGTPGAAAYTTVASDGTSDSILHIPAGCTGDITITSTPLSITSLSVSGSWTNTQKSFYAPDITGLTFTATYSDNSTSTVTPTSVSPSVWSNTNVTQTATFYYKGSSVGLDATVECSPLDPPIISVTQYLLQGGDSNPRINTNQIVRIIRTAKEGTTYYKVNDASSYSSFTGESMQIATYGRGSYWKISCYTESNGVSSVEVTKGSNIQSGYPCDCGCSSRA